MNSTLSSSKGEEGITTAAETEDTVEAGVALSPDELNMVIRMNDLLDKDSLLPNRLGEFFTPKGIKVVFSANLLSKNNLINKR